MPDETKRWPWMGKAGGPWFFLDTGTGGWPCDPMEGTEDTEPKRILAPQLLLPPNPQLPSWHSNKTQVPSSKFRVPWSPATQEHLPRWQARPSLFSDEDIVGRGSKPFSDLHHQSRCSRRSRQADIGAGNELCSAGLLGRLGRAAAFSWGAWETAAQV